MLPRLYLLLLLSQGAVSQPCTGPQPVVVPAHLRKASTVAAPNQLQRALDSGAYFVDVPPLPGGLPWLVPPLCLRSNQTVRFQPGVVILAKQGLFHGVRDALLNAVHTVNTTVIGYGAVLRMRRLEYMDRSKYAFGATRGGVNLWAAAQVKLLGLHVEDCGGDGLMVMRLESPTQCGWHSEVAMAVESFRRPLLYFVWRNTNET